MSRRTQLGLAAAGVAAAANAYRPISRRRGVAAGPIWASAWTATEAPRLSAAVQAGILAVGLRRGSAGPLATTLAGASVAAHLGLYDISRRSHITLEAALVEALGPDYHAGISGPPRPPGSQIDPRRLRPRAARRRYVQIDDSRIAYADGGRRNELDVWRHPELPAHGKAPVLIQIHGGAWATGDNKMQAIPLMTRLAEHGWICVAPNYRLSPKYRWPAHIVDVNRAIAWTKANIARFGGDPDFIALSGGSAGGHLSSLASLSSTHDAFRPGFEDTDTSVQAVVPYYGAYDWLDRDGTANPFTQEFVVDKVLDGAAEQAQDALQHGSPRSWVGHHAPPFFVLHGENDAMLPVEQARSFVAALRQASAAPVVYAELPKAQHAFDLTNSPRARQTAAAVEQFLDVVWHHRNVGSGLTTAASAGS